MPSYLVTGGAGFIGSHLVEELVRRGESVRIVDNFSTGLRGNVPNTPHVEVIEGDLSDPAVADQAVAGCTYVLHQAALPSVPRSVQDPLTSHRSNVDATLQLLLAARHHKVQRVVYTGSSSVYGNTPVLPKREDMKTSPLSPYALQKLMSEQYCVQFSRLYGLETVTTRYFNVFGPRQVPFDPVSGVISLFVKAIAEGRKPVIYGDGRQTRDFTYVANVVDGVLRACTAADVSGEVMNLATGGRISLLELATVLQARMGRETGVEFAPVREGDVKDSQADIFKARRLLGYEPTVPFEEGISRTVDWFRSTQH